MPGTFLAFFIVHCCLITINSKFHGPNAEIASCISESCQNKGGVKLTEAISPTDQLCENVTVSEAEIARDIFRDHFSWERPLMNARHPIDVEIRLVLSSINNIVEKDKILKLTGYLLLYWYDEFRVWNTTFPHACLGSVVLPHHEVWIPEIAMINSEQHYELLLMHNEELVRVQSNGFTSYRPGGAFRVYCDYDLTYFPFDSQICNLTLESWRYTVEFQIFHFGDDIRFRYWIENEQWDLVKTSQSLYIAAYVTSNRFHRVEFQLFLKRKVMYYLINVIIPSVIISVAEIATFTLPVDEPTKIHISFTCLLAYGVFQVMIIADIPRTSDRIPLICYYIALSMAYICLAMLGEGAVFVCIRKGNDKRQRQYVPDFFYKSACLAATLLCMKKPDFPMGKEDSSEQKFEAATMMRYSKMEHTPYISILDLTLTEPSELERKQEATRKQIDEKYTHHDHEIVRLHKWDFVADVLDRCVLVIYVLLIFLTPLVMFVLIPFVFHH